MTARDPQETRLGRLLRLLRRNGRQWPFTGDPDGLSEVLRRYDVQPAPPPPPPPVAVPDPGGGRPRVPGRQNDPTWVFPFRTAWRDLARQASARRSGRSPDERGTPGRASQA